MSKQLALNPSPVAREVVIVNEDGKKDSIFLQPQSKAKLPDGWTICPDFKSRNPVIKSRDLSN